MTLGGVVCLNRRSGRYLVAIAAAALSSVGGVAFGGEPHLRTAATLGAARPAAVPGDYLLTPHGFFHPSCVVEVAKGERVAADNTLVRSNGSKRAVAPCQFERYDRAGRVVPRGSGSDSQLKASAAFTDGWVTFAAAFPAPISKLYTQWKVPQRPTNIGNQILYFFPGFVPPSNAEILQPVLQFFGYEGANAQWSIGSWDCCASGNDWHGPFADVSPGDLISGTLTGSSCNASTGVCSNWSIETLSSSGAQSVLNVS